jgi:hypothetical protein
MPSGRAKDPPTARLLVSGDGWLTDGFRALLAQVFSRFD